MPLFLIPLALSLFSAGAGIVNQVNQNNQLQDQANQAINDLQEKNKADLLHQSVEYIRAIDAQNDLAVALDAQAKQDQAQTAQRVTAALLGTAALLLVLAIVVLVKKK